MPNALQHPAKMTGAPAQRTFSSGINRLELIGQHPTEIKKKLKRALADIRKGKNKKSSRLLIEIIGSNPENIDALHLLGHGYMSAGDSELAESMFLRALGQAPDNIIINDTLGKFYHSQSHFQKAAPYLQKVYELAPDNRPNLIRLALGFYFQDVNDAAMSVARELAHLEDSEPCLSENMRQKLHVLLSNTISRSRNLHEYIGLAQDLNRLFQLDYINHSELGPAASGYLVNKYAISGNLDSPTDLNVLENDTLLLNLLEKSIVTDHLGEGWLTRIRRALLDEYTATGSISGHENLTSALAIHNFINDYVYPISRDEYEKVQVLCNDLGASLDNHALLVIGLYRSLVSVPRLASKVDKIVSFPQPTNRLIRVALKEPLEEKIIAASLPSLGKVSNSISNAVQNQYEESPYPRWTTISHSDKRPYAIWFRQLAPNIDIPDTIRQKPLHMLVAGCGTGRHPIMHGSRVRDVQILAVDISRASLAYGKRMADKLGLRNIEFMQADILNLPDLNRKFPVIESIGVLHHMKNPEQGWTILRDMLEPGGIMKIGLYSQTARRDITRVREHISEIQIEPTPENIRHYRHELLNNNLSVEQGALSQFTDTHYLNGCRDLLFHVQEHQFDIPRIKNALDSLGLRFLGFDIQKPAIRKSFEAEHPRPEDWLDIDKWEAFEEEHPDTFSSMYNFICTTL